MDCYEIEERILEGFEGTLSSEEKEQLESHLSACPRCAQFAALQRELDVRLQEGIASPLLSPSFSVALHAKMAQMRPEPWPDWLPDVAHFAGSAVAIVSCALFLPLPVPVVLGVGTVVALVAYSLQTVIVGTLEQWTE